MADSPPPVVDRARGLFLREENSYGCAETALIALQEEFGLPDPTDSSPAMALNGGVAYSGGVCGAITGVGLAVGRLAESRIDDHREAKTAARRILQRLMVEFEQEFSATDCRDLTGYDLLRDHDAFIEDGAWRTACMRQIEFAVERLAGLAEAGEWQAELERQAAE
mgnify:CR=1 FL=1